MTNAMAQNSQLIPTHCVALGLPLVLGQKV